MIEYKIIELDMPAELTAIIAKSYYGNPASHEERISINEYVGKELNKLGKEGWMLHNSGLSSLPTLLLFKNKK